MMSEIIPPNARPEALEIEVTGTIIPSRDVASSKFSGVINPDSTPDFNPDCTLMMSEELEITIAPAEQYRA